MTRTIYKILPETMWREAEKLGVFEGAPIDLKDGYIHFSTADQVKQTAALHFSAQPSLVLAAFDADALGDKLIFEPSRGGALFPHLYAKLETAKAKSVRPLPVGADSLHVFPELDD